MWNLDSFTITLSLMTIVLTAYVLLIIVARVISPLRRVGFHVRLGFAAPFSKAMNELNRERRFDELEEEIRRALGEDDSWGEQERVDIVTAAAAAQQISIIDRRLRETVDRCLRTHWAVAKGLGAIDMSDAARHPLSNRLRQRVIDLADMLNKKLITYPLLIDSPQLIQLQIGLRWIPATCTACPYRACSVASAPKICPTAKAMGRDRTSNNTGDGVLDAEIVDDCGEGR